MKKLLYFATIIALISCKKDESTSQNNNQAQLYHVPLAIGNYWVYENFNVNPDMGTVQNSGLKDSIVIQRDILIKGNTYFVRMGIIQYTGNNSWGLVDLVRDSSGYLVNEKGTVLFAENDFVNTFNSWSLVVGNNDTIADIFYTMEPYLDVIHTASGDYNGGLNYKGTVIQYISDSSFTKYFNNVYAEDIGKIFETSFFAGTTNNWIEKRLSNYLIQ